MYYLAEVRRHIHRWCRGMEAWEVSGLLTARAKRSLGGKILKT